MLATDIVNRLYKLFCRDSGFRDALWKYDPYLWRRFTDMQRSGDRRLKARGKPIPWDRQHEAILTGQWLAEHLGRKLRRAEAQTFGRMCVDTWRKHYGPYANPPTIRLARDSSQRIAYLPEHEPLLMEALHRYRNSKTYQRIEREIKEEQQ